MQDELIFLGVFLVGLLIVWGMNWISEHVFPPKPPLRPGE